MTTDVEVLRGKVRDLCARHDRGDVPQRDFERGIEKDIVELYKAVVRERLVPGETIVREHHVLHAHLKLSQSILREPACQAVSLFATDTRLLRLRSRFTPGSPVSADEKDDTTIDAIPYASISELTLRRQPRLGEALAGLAIVIFALLLLPWLQITGKLLMVLGTLGALHGLLMPTRWIEIRAEGAERLGPISIHALRKKSARRLLRLLRERVAGRSLTPGVA